MSAAKYVAATMKVPVRDQPDRCSHQSGFFHSPCASPTMYPVSATASSTGSAGSPPGQSPSGANANIAARFIRSVGERCGTSDSREEAGDFDVQFASDDVFNGPGEVRLAR